MATQSSILGLQSMESQIVGRLRDWAGTVAHQAPLSMGFPKQEYWSGLPLPPPGDLSDPGIKPTSCAGPALAGRFYTTTPPGKPLNYMYSVQQSSTTLSFEFSQHCVLYKHRVRQCFHFHLLRGTLYFSISTSNPIPDTQDVIIKC